MAPGLQQRPIANQFLAGNDVQTHQWGYHPQEEEQKGQQTQGRPSLPILSLRNGLQPTLRRPSAQAQGQGQTFIHAHPIHYLFVRLAPEHLDDRHQQEAAVPIQRRSPTPTTRQTRSSYAPAHRQGPLRQRCPMNRFQHFFRAQTPFALSLARDGRQVQLRNRFRDYRLDPAYDRLHVDYSSKVERRVDSALSYSTSGSSQPF